MPNFHKKKDYVKTDEIIIIFIKNSHKNEKISQNGRNNSNNK